MADVKLIIMHPGPNDIEAFEYVYQREHVPLAIERVAGKTGIVASKELSSPRGTPAFYALPRSISRLWQLWMRAPRPREESWHWLMLCRFHRAARPLSW
jgi:hypothetical protein